MKKILFIGSKTFGARSLESLLETKALHIEGIVTIDDTEDIRSSLREFEALAGKYTKELHILGKSSELQSIVEKKAPDLCVVVGWYKIITPEVIKIPVHGFIGVHNSLLPKYRGGSPLVWSILEGGTEVGYSIFQLEKGVDDGDIWHQEQIELKRTETIAHALSNIESSIESQLPNTVVGILDGSRRSIQQDLTGSVFCMPRKPVDGQIDWNLPAAQLHDFIRSQANPYPGAFTSVQEQKLVVSESYETGLRACGKAGSVTYSETSLPSIICGDGYILNIKFKEASERIKFGVVLGNQIIK